MHWIDALAEMKKNPGKVFKCGPTTFKFQNGELIQSVNGDPVWKVRAVLGVEQQKDWVEVPQWKKVDYAEFMEWYCNPANRGKVYHYSLQNTPQDVHTSSNEMSVYPEFIYSKMTNFEIPNE